MISIGLFGGLGNHLWQYAVNRTIAEKNNYEFHVPRNFFGSYFFDCDLGVEQGPVNFLFQEHKSQAFQAEAFEIKDFTHLEGYFQTEKYILQNKHNVQKWFTFKNPNPVLRDALNINNDNMCVINFRGGDYCPSKSGPKIAETFLTEKYWVDSVNAMLKINPAMQFTVVTDDIEEAQKFFPDFPVYHWNVNDDFYIVNQAKYLIIANSTFAWWAAWLNTNSLFTIAPKYWFKHNVSSGWWCNADSITTGFQYIDREGQLLTAEQCAQEYSDLQLDIKDYPYLSGLM